MNDSQRQSTSHAPVKWRVFGANRNPIRRLIVLLPDEDINEPELARRLWLLAAPNGAEVFIVARMDDWADEPQIRLRIALLSALLRESDLQASAHIESDTDWIRVVRRWYRPGDLIVCHAEQTLPDSLNGLNVTFKPLSAFIAALHMPVCEMTGIVRPRPKPTVKRVMKTWVVPLLVIGGSTVLQVLFINWASNWALGARNFVLGISAAIEVLTVAWFANS